jgi:hypothetical protein
MMADNSQSWIIDDLKKEFQLLTEKFRPKSTTPIANTENISLIDFWNLFYKYIDENPKNQPISLKLKIGGNELSFETDQVSAIRSLEACFDKKQQDNSIFMNPTEYMEKSREIYGMFSFMIDSMKENSKNMQTVGHKYILMNYESNGTKCYSAVPVQDAIDFMDSIQPVNMFDSIPEIIQPNLELNNQEIPPNQALYLTIKVKNLMMEKIPDMLKERFGTEPKNELPQEFEHWDFIFDLMMDQIQFDTEFEEIYKNFDTTLEICQKVMRERKDEVQALIDESPNIKAQWDEMGERKRKIIKEFLEI